jgi:hypothetical protein
MSTTHQLLALLTFAVRRRWLFLLVAAVALAALLLSVFGSWKPLTSTVEHWNTHASPIISLATFLIAFAVWFQQLRRAWLDDLPKRLTVTFTLDGKEVMRCDLAHLPDAASARELAQQIGRQMADPEHGKLLLTFCAADVHLTNDGPDTAAIDGQEILFQHYHLELRLTKRPETLHEGVRVLWQPPFNRDRLLNVNADGTQEPRLKADNAAAPKGQD